MNRKRLAVNLSGSLKFWSRSLQTIRKLSDTYDISVFIHCWENSELLNEHSWKFSPYAFEADGSAANIISQYAHVACAKIETFAERLDLFQGIFAKVPYHIRNAATVGPISMFYSMHCCSELIKEYENTNGQFDAIVRLRFECLLGDLNFFENADQQVILPAVCEDIWETTEAAACDWFAYGPSNLMHQYFSVFQNIVELCESGCILYGEGLLGTHLWRSRVPVLRKCVPLAIANNQLPSAEDVKFFKEAIGEHAGPVLRDDPNVLWVDWYGRYQYGQQ